MLGRSQTQLLDLKNASKQIQKENARNDTDDIVLVDDLLDKSRV